jgi:hypothetical protein
VAEGIASDFVVYLELYLRFRRVGVAAVQAVLASVLTEMDSDAELRGRVADLLKAHPELERFREEAQARASSVDMPAVPEHSGAVIGPYKLLQPLGEGSMSFPLSRTIAETKGL